MVLQGSITYLNDWKLAQNRLQPAPSTAGSPPCPKWHPPPIGHLKCNMSIETLIAQHRTDWGMAGKVDSARQLLEDCRGSNEDDDYVSHEEDDEEMEVRMKQLNRVVGFDLYCTGNHVT
ncbi:hypothetical protein LINGRAHAP2_LOCUS2407 [Linum grandiflorum]